MESCMALDFDDPRHANRARRAEKVCPVDRPADNMSDATVMLAAIEAGDSQATEQLLVLVYDESNLRSLRVARATPASPLCGWPFRAEFSLLAVWVGLDTSRNKRSGRGQRTQYRRRCLVRTN